MDAQAIEAILRRHPKDPSSIIQVMLDIENELYFLPRDVLDYVSKYLDVPMSRIYNLATFYKAFSLKEKGKFPIAVCLGTACHVQGALRIMDQIERELHIKEGETTADKKFSVDSVRCLGCCGLAPVMTVGKNLHGRIPPSKVSKILKQYE
jgi:NADH-quinone oxidoreductase subunit E